MNELSRRLISLTLAFLLVLPAGGSVWAEDGEDTHADTDPGNSASVQSEEYDLVEGTFVSDQVMVVFRSGAVDNQKLSLKSARRQENIGDNYGEALSATGEIAEAAKDAKSEVEIISASLGDDFVIEDSIAVDDDLIIALVSSEKYDTETLIELLSANEDVESAEPNYYQEPQSYEYSLNDPLNKYIYYSNSPEAENKGGENVSSQGTDPEKVASINAGHAWSKYSGSDDEVVVAVVDSGINCEHEDLKDVLWTNPGDIGLAGEHGFNLSDNDVCLDDGNGHGTHVSGILAAAANNGKGVAGVASGVNVKIMMLSTSPANPPSDEMAESSVYDDLGAFNYVLKAFKGHLCQKSQRHCDI